MLSRSFKFFINVKLWVARCPVVCYFLKLQNNPGFLGERIAGWQPKQKGTMMHESQQSNFPIPGDWIIRKEAPVTQEAIAWQGPVTRKSSQRSKKVNRTRNSEKVEAQLGRVWLRPERDKPNTDITTLCNCASLHPFRWLERGGSIFSVISLLPGRESMLPGGATRSRQ